MGIWRHLRAIGLLPGVATMVVPAGLSPLLSWLPPLLGCFLIALGVLLMYKTISLFATVGEGTLAPWVPSFDERRRDH